GQADQAAQHRQEDPAEHARHALADLAALGIEVLVQGARPELLLRSPRTQSFRREFAGTPGTLVTGECRLGAHGIFFLSAAGCRFGGYHSHSRIQSAHRTKPNIASLWVSTR